MFSLENVTRATAVMALLMIAAPATIAGDEISWEVESASFDRTWDWDITKTVDRETVELSVGETTSVDYTIAVDLTETMDNYVIAGVVEWQEDDDNESTSQVLSWSGAGAVTDFSCDQDFDPSTVFYSCDWTVKSPVEPGAADFLTLTLDFPPFAPTITSDFTPTDEITSFTENPIGSPSILVLDANTSESPFGPFTADASFGYTSEIGPYATEGVFLVDNTAIIQLSDNNEFGASASAQVRVTVSDVPVPGTILLLSLGLGGLGFAGRRHASRSA